MRVDIYFLLKNDESAQIGSDCILKISLGMSGKNIFTVGESWHFKYSCGRKFYFSSFIDRVIYNVLGDAAKYNLFGILSPFCRKAGKMQRRTAVAEACACSQ